VREGGRKGGRERKGALAEGFFRAETVRDVAQTLSCGRGHAHLANARMRA
jgi:hypothetical protein